jgi:hypothetical protein
VKKAKAALRIPELPCSIEAIFVAVGVGICVQLADRPSRRFDPNAWYQLMIRIGPDNSGAAFGVRALDTAPDDPAWAVSRDSFLWMLRRGAIVVAAMHPIRNADKRGAVRDPHA